MGRNPNGSISIFERRGRLYLQFPRRWFGGEQKYHALNLPDTEINRSWAQERIATMHLDYLRGEFDPTLSKYFTEITPILATDLKLSQLWAEYCQYKSPRLKTATIFYLTSTLGHHITKCPYQAINQALEVRIWLLNHTTPAMTKRVLASLATAVKWGVKHGKIANPINPFMGMAEDIRSEKDEPHPNAFTHSERDLIIRAFESSYYYYHYSPLVKFWFLTGCRPSEGIGLEWSQINPDCSKIKFDRSIVRVGREVVRNNKSKTNRNRTFPANNELKNFLFDYRSQFLQPHTNLVFPSPTGKSIEYSNFCDRAWTRIVKPIVKRHSTPYSCRDTFITDQIAKGIPIAVIAKWCDNSVQMIEQHYLDPTVDQLKPL
jgi:integrase